MNQVAVINSARYIKLFIVAVALVALTSTFFLFRGINKLAPLAKILTLSTPAVKVTAPSMCDDVVFLHRVGGWDIATNPDGKSVMLGTITKWNETSSNARRSLVVSCAK